MQAAKHSSKYESKCRLITLIDLELAQESLEDFCSSIHNNILSYIYDQAMLQNSPIMYIKSELFFIGPEFFFLQLGASSKANQIEEIRSDHTAAHL
jgi:hypothetical protein